MDLADRLRLDHPVGQAGMGGGLAGAALAAAVANAGGLGTLGIDTPRRLRASINQVRQQAPGRAVAVNLLLPFVHRHHVAACVDAWVDAVVLAFGDKRGLVQHLRDAGVFVFVMVGTEAQARAAIACGADGLIAQGREAGGHLVGTVPALDFLPHALRAAGNRPVLLAGGVATAADTRAALDCGASGVIAGTRFLLTHEANASREYQRRILRADRTIETNLFGLSWPLRHRVVPNQATRRWCRADGRAKVVPAALNAASRPLSALGYFDAGALMRLQSPALPFFTPLAPVAGVPDSWLDGAALYAGETALRIGELTSAGQAVADLSPR
ncbi:nitronate monooxygenase [Mycobacterium intracellulare]|uniref:nitronate monooxygenase n=1 Tax=Mycobacterium intracellulare TaxID=1767 RepID=UPI0004485053|nr:nitronate monooxygenase [Mycobacterium intracellulare]AOS94064.1 oxidoreductase [Mycobacterium intracellulare subsp. chimaera]ARV84597.1 oxidoreductase [Mycobacterium intracellulare subsp. chimaera]ASL11957.1 oxidoreductase, 2-nitropropane dioxygenase family protein [Mycobacterium intracellulare subsp. chimaera]ASL23906.1 oxidoreductase, 2-nitropropane dioxygenase family protein [Mycobacterium intracellulare subsp. chimaera]ETZ27024.1 nitronate monooxygenase family protein [Mycobacterium in